jgi:hypothetical protein
MRKKKQKGEIEGEGSYSATRRYDEGVKRFIDEDDPAERARKALEEVERDEPGYRKAEEEGKRHAAEEDPELYRKGTEKDRLD